MLGSSNLFYYFLRYPTYSEYIALQTFDFLTGAAIFDPHNDPADHFTMDDQHQLRGQAFLEEMLMSRKASAFFEPNGENTGLGSQNSVLTPVVECRFPYSIPSQNYSSIFQSFQNYKTVEDPATADFIEQRLAFMLEQQRR